VCATFGVLDRPVSLAGGQGGAWRVGPLVLKRVGVDPVVAEEVRWLGTALSVEMGGVRVAVPVAATDRRWVVDGWSATPFLEGGPAGWRWDDVLAACAAFHAAVAHLPRPTFLDRRRTPWDVGDRMAWGDSMLEVRTPGLRPLVDRLAAGLRPVAELGLVSQLVHGDLGGNVLLDPAAVLDLSPYWRPPAWALAVVVVDALVWADADPSLADGHDPQLLARAMLYRLVTDDVVGQDTSAVNEPTVDLIVARL
jgi:uncharacterized protein (TIGR02569 family)